MIKALIQCGTCDDVDRVIVDGRTVLEDGPVVGLDEHALPAHPLSPPLSPPLAADPDGAPHA